MFQILEQYLLQLEEFVSFSVLHSLKYKWLKNREIIHK